MIPVSGNVDLAGAAFHLENHFRGKGFEVQSLQGLSGSWQVSLRKGGMFKSILGLKTALNVTLQQNHQSVSVDADVGIFGSQGIPTFITVFVFWPVLVTQIWGLVVQSNLDDEAVSCVEQYVSSASLGSPRQQPGSSLFCTHCATPVQVGMKFCPDCGNPIQFG